MKKLYEPPEIMIELFLGQDIVAFSGGNNPGGEDWDGGDDGGLIGGDSAP